MGECDGTNGVMCAEQEACHGDYAQDGASDGSAIDPSFEDTAP